MANGGRWAGPLPTFTPPPAPVAPPADDDVVIASTVPNASLTDLLTPGLHRAHRPTNGAPACDAEWPGGEGGTWALVGAYRIGALNASLCPDPACFGDPAVAA